MSTLQSILLASLFSVELPREAQTSWSESSAPWEQQAVLDEAVVLASAQLQVEGLLESLGVEGEVQGRVKSPESLAAKAARKGLTEAEVLDRLALRVIVDEVEECDLVHGALVQAFPVVPGSEDDYIRAPKANGYQSLHMALNAGPSGEVVEVQLRTVAMHAHAEYGGAAHGAYKAAQQVAVQA